jgi:hypothetical protein
MLRFLHIEYLDGTKEVHGITDSIGAVRVREGQLLVSGGDGSYKRRGEQKGFPMTNVRKWWTSDED